ncbi:MAG: helix-turn-helix domain-containing protein [Corallococcus sp.]|nr:helix-turn-helix domain-containing protein [Corallococcus sp.]
MFKVLLKNLREEKKLTQENVCEKLNVSRNCYASYEQGRTEPNIEMLVKLANLFECSVDYLLGRVSDIDTIEIQTDLTEQQKELLSNFDRLNTEGKARLLGYLLALLGMPAYSRKQ